ncbi:General alpha-glucoside permease OS=Schizosaccharomyces pombe (strain 972 / ATCC 24843) GN=sut1 PE=3 SV=1 [Rhizoctonia solani AG-1 IB]|uniref:General alpha-glucoside permease n=1 Tax=Thanatephorus cucumeris (strain AG1-IB / isolate 7/3/14) TaxID=1108050 RepID=A0A0B7FPG1_THACB|nr:General alpha-glucoside permease OS=Schizosaccharomyces pombe (strain 972 / ATCC 24843) GN=sut1 PE=3 SV=1 [Rhizoctonia solani AG-1 IB]
MVLFPSLQNPNSEANLGYIIGPQWLHLPILALPGLGTAVLWASMMSHATPTLLSLGMSKSTLSLVFLAGPLSGIIMQPLIGALADASTSKYGRRRPFMMGGCLVCVPAMLGLGFARGIGETLWPSHAQGIAILISVLSIVCIDFAVNAIMSADRALIVDMLPPHEQNSGNAWASRTSGLGQVLGFFIGNLDLPYMFGSNSSQIGLLSVISGILLLGTHVITAIFVQEAVHQPRPGDATDLKQMLRNMWDTVLRLPATIRSICFIQFFSWLGWLPVMLFATEYIGDIYVRDALDHGDSRGPSSEALREEGTRAGSRALFHGALLTLFASIMLPLFVVSRSEADHQSIGGIVWELSKRLPLEVQQTLHKWRETKFDLAKTWAVSHMVFGVLLLCTLLVQGPGFASFIFVLIGLCSAVSAWAPYALLGEAIAAEQQGGRIHGGASQADLDVSLALLNDAEDWENVQRVPEAPASEQGPQQAGIILGIHNIFVVIPQFVIIGVSSAIFALLDTKQLLHPGGSDASDGLAAGKQAESIGVIFRIGGICSGIAAFLTLQLAKSLRKNYSL